MVELCPVNYGAPLPCDTLYPAWYVPLIYIIVGFSLTWVTMWLFRQWYTVQD